MCVALLPTGISFFSHLAFHSYLFLSFPSLGFLGSDQIDFYHVTCVFYIRT